MIDFTRLPKAELHCHLDGSVRPGTMLDIARREHTALPADDVAGLKRALRAGSVRQSLVDYLEAFALSLKVLQTEAALERVMYELVCDAAAESCWRLETRFCPLLNQAGGLSLEQVLGAVLRGQRRGVAETGISAGVILCGLKNFAPADNLRVAELGVAHKSEGVVAFDLAGPELDHPVKPHAAAVACARDGGLQLTVHAGEADGAAAIAEALSFGAERIGHGTRLGEDPALLERVRKDQVALEVCLRSNLETQAVASLAAHPFPRYLRAGVRVTLNTDNRLMSDVRLSDEYASAASLYALTPAEVATVARNGFVAAFVSASERTQLLARVDAALGELRS